MVDVTSEYEQDPKDGSEVPEETTPVTTGPVLDPVPVKTGISPKLIFSSVASFVAPALLLGLLFLQTDEGQEYFGGLPQIVIVILGGLITSGIAFLSGYIKRDPLREYGQKALNGTTSRTA